ncbi:FAD-binding oxidoreductase [Thermobifida halotolerans]|uniref:FAD-binding oxidoreductase n=1 Tax=Thermobifida halotolerans TaxID=483545 RepID=A0AA97M380_9ACTN|nr:FAD-binding oxidoreductase [Thermobifida halotolerans]UOE18878.1 FAD-binding oxidoreductase [Thermobifida halotolerans]
MAIDRRSLLRIGAAVAAASVTGGAGASAAAPAFAHGGGRRGKWDRLRRHVRGDVVLPGDPSYDQAIQLQVAEYDRIRPAAVLYCENEHDVRTGILFAQDHGLRTAARSGGHSNAGYSTTEGLVIDVSRMKGVSVGATCSRIETGLQAVDALDALTPHGIALPNGTCPTVAAAGFVTGGGTGPFSRKHGVASDNIRAARVVLADGRTVVCNEYRRPDLLWAVRGGGGGNFGIITQYTLDQVPITRMCQYRLVWHWNDAVHLITGLQEWITDLPEEIAADLLVIAPTTPGAAPLVQLVGTSLGSLDTLDTELDRLVGLTGRQPTERSAVDLPYRDAMMRVWGCSEITVEQCHRTGSTPEGTLPRDAFRLTRSRLVDDPIPETGVEDILGAFENGRAAGQIRVMSLRVMGGQVNSTDPRDTAFFHRTAAFNISFTFGLTSTDASEEEKQTVLGHLHDGFEVFDSYANGHTLQNFTDPYLENWREAYYGDNRHRLHRIKKKYDPHGFFDFEQSVS